MDDVRRELMARIEEVRDRLVEHVEEGGRLAVVQAPPGSGKTHILLAAARRGFEVGQRVAVATQTNNQADDICERMVEEHPGVAVTRFASSTATRGDLDLRVGFARKPGELPDGPCVVVGTGAKWGQTTLGEVFDVVFVEEAWQMSWADFMLLSRVAGRFVLIGDPGQIAPVVEINVERWETAPRPPHRPAPEVVLADPPEDLLSLQLPATWRLPADSVELVRPFYEFEFEAVASPDSRRLLPAGLPDDKLGRALARLDTGSVLVLTLPTPEGGPPLEQDDEVAALAARVAELLAGGGVRYRMDGEEGTLEPADLGLCATHRVMLTALSLALPEALRAEVRVDTPERWQGLQRKVMVVVHPLSGVTRPSEFGLDTGRLCVMASRHQVALVVVTRDHVGETLEEFFPSATQAPGRPDETGLGHARNLAFWSALEDQGRVVVLDT